MGFARGIDYFDLARVLSFVSWDNYINKYMIDPYQLTDAMVALNHDKIRGLKDQNFWVMEHQSAPRLEQPGETPRPGEIRKWTWQSVAHGAEGNVLFPRRTCTFGTEQYWYGILI
jgi:beta-galactosidase